MLPRPLGPGLMKFRHNPLQNERARRILLLSEVPKRNFRLRGSVKIIRRTEETMKESDEIIKRQSTQIRFHNKDMDFMFNWNIGLGALVGLSHGELFNLVEGMKDGDAGQWRERFGRHGRFPCSARRDRQGRGRGAGPAGGSLLLSGGAPVLRPNGGDLRQDGRANGDGVSCGHSGAGRPAARSRSAVRGQDPSGLLPGARLDAQAARRDDRRRRQLP